MCEREKKWKRLRLQIIQCSPSDGNLPVPGTQIPIRVYLCIATNKSQGDYMTGNLGLDHRDDCFSHGQLYVDLSRTTNTEIFLRCTSIQDGSTRNVLCPEILSFVRIK